MPVVEIGLSECHKAHESVRHMLLFLVRDTSFLLENVIGICLLSPHFNLSNLITVHNGSRAS